MKGPAVNSCRPSRLVLRYDGTCFVCCALTEKAADSDARPQIRWNEILTSLDVVRIPWTSRSTIVHPC